MKKLLILSTILFPTFTLADTKITAPDMDLGHWVTTVDQSQMIDQMLSSMPEETRAMMRSMMEEQLKDSATTELCVTPEYIDNYDQQIKDAFKQEGTQDCAINVIESTKKKFIGDLTCSGSVMNISMVVINSKRQESSIEGDFGGIGNTKLTTVSEWKSSSCPEGI